MPDARELQQRPEERADPLGEARLSPVPGLVHRYPDRVLLKLTHVCPVYCRFCFRREVVGPGGPQALSGEALDAALGYIAGVPGIWEVILTGGDPFMLSPRRIAEVTRRLGDDSPRQGAALAHARAGGGARARHGRARRGAEVGRQDGLRRAARQPCRAS